MKWLAALSCGICVSLITAVLMGVRLRLRRGRGADQGRMRLWMAQAGLQSTPFQFIMISVGVGLLGLAVLRGLAGVWAVALPPAALIALLPCLYYTRVRARRMSEVRRAWPDGIRDLHAAVSSGFSIQRGLENLARSGPGPLREAFGRFPVLARAMGVIPALESIKEDLADPTSDRVIEVLRIAHEKGGSMVTEILKDLAESTSLDLAANEEQQTEALEQRINARVVFTLPWGVLVALTLRPGPFRAFYSSPPGLVVIAAGAGLSLLGITLVSRLARTQDEPRVLTTGAGARGR